MHGAVAIDNMGWVTWDVIRESLSARIKRFVSVKGDFLAP